MNEIMPQEFWQGVEQFNSEQFYTCHDTLEALWMEATEPERSFYQGILQIAVALYHLGNRNLRGAVILLGEGSNRLRRYPSSYGGVELSEFLEQSRALLHQLQRLEPNQQQQQQQTANYDWSDRQNWTMPKIVLINK